MIARITQYYHIYICHLFPPFTAHTSEPGLGRYLAGTWPGLGRDLAGTWLGLGLDLTGTWPGLGRDLAGVGKGLSVCLPHY